MQKKHNFNMVFLDGFLFGISEKWEAMNIVKFHQASYLTMRTYFYEFVAGGIWIVTIVVRINCQEIDK